MVIPPPPNITISVLSAVSFFFFPAGKKDVDDGSADMVDIPKRTTPARGTVCVSASLSDDF